jgi:transposase-like protein
MLPDLKTLHNAILYFDDEMHAIEVVATMRWPDGRAVCLYCDCKENYWLQIQKRWKCKGSQCRKQFSVKVNTIFEDSPIALGKWLVAIWMLANCKNGISSYELHRDLGITQKTAWFMLHRIRLGLQNGF